jgi:predicted ribosomally synthesized peptide with nif11-like leader
MSKMKELYEKVAGDIALQTKFSEIMEQAKSDGEEATGDKLILFAKDAGYDITLDEMKAFFEAMAESADRPLSDTELDMVAGGKVGSVLVSIFTLGTGCIIGSILGEISTTPGVNCSSHMRNS